MRVALAAVLFAEPDLLLLDEPTNYLDLEGTLWLESYLANYPHTVLIDQPRPRPAQPLPSTSILHLDQRQADALHAAATTTSSDSAARAAAAASGKLRKKQDDEREHMQSFVDRFKAKATQGRARPSRRVKALAKMKPIAAAVDDRSACRSTFRSRRRKPHVPPIIAIEDVGVGYERRQADAAPARPADRRTTTASPCSAPTATASRPSPS